MTTMTWAPIRDRLEPPGRHPVSHAASDSAAAAVDPHPLRAVVMTPRHWLFRIAFCAGFGLEALLSLLGIVGIDSPGLLFNVATLAAITGLIGECRCLLDAAPHDGDDIAMEA